MSKLNKMKSLNPFTNAKAQSRWLKRGSKKGWITVDPSFTGQMKCAGLALKGAFQKIPTPVKVVAGVGTLYALADIGMGFLDVRKGREMYEGQRVKTHMGPGRCIEFARAADSEGNLALIAGMDGKQYYVPVEDVSLRETLSQEAPEVSEPEVKRPAKREEALG